jgi:hypothetical protein
MTANRLTGLVVALWLILALLIAFIGSHAAHFSAREFVVPQRDDPVSWISTSLLYAPPILLAIAHSVPRRVSAILKWALAATLVVVIASAFAVFSPSAYLGF